ncbi:MAG TPA: thioesterase family protein [Candidatus Dormibacteraeota bacterium]|nr:thioesterase family protein [Candidatus Dormibacteraeota bacterium]
MTSPSGPHRPEPEPLPEAFYLPAGDGVFRPTRATESPWDPDTQHGGPVSALLAHAMRRLGLEPGFLLARITVEFLGVVPRSELRLAARVVRPGRRVRLLEAEAQARGRAVALARVWEIAARPGELPGSVAPASRRSIPPPQPQRFFAGLVRWGYGEAIEWRWARGAYDRPGPADVWARPRIPLVAGEPTCGLDRVLIVADSANGVGAVLRPEEYLFVPPAVTVTLHRHPEDEWVNLRARTRLSAEGIGSTLAVLADRRGELGSVTQPLLVTARR